MTDVVTVRTTGNSQAACVLCSYGVRGYSFWVLMNFLIGSIPGTRGFEGNTHKWVSVQRIVTDLMNVCLLS